MSLRHIMIVIALMAPQLAAADELVLPDGAPLVLGSDLCEIVKTCLPAEELGLPQNVPDLLVPEWGLDTIANIAGTQSPEQAQSYAQGLSDRSLVDQCEKCKCCVVNADGVNFAPGANLSAEYFHGLVVIGGE
jgi:hypothetical protein